MGGEAALEGHARYAVYWAPRAGSDLARLGAAWLGRDAEADRPVARPDLGVDLAAHTERPRRYGFHATLKPPFALAEGCDAAALDRAVAQLAASLAPVSAPGLALDTGLGFLALRPAGPAPALDALAARVVEALEPFRAPLASDEIARRRAHGLAPREEALLLRWGYPYVMEAFRFHLTLTGPVSGLEAHHLTTAARVHFAPAFAARLSVGELCLFADPGGGAPFRLLRRHPLGG